MSRPREPIALLEAKGKKHLTKAERAKRTASEPALAAPASGEGSKIRAPDWLPEWLREDFNALRAKLVAAGIFSGLDRDTLGRYLVARHQFTAAMGHVNDALDAEDVEGAAAWGREQERAFKQARACACDLGLTISSRCRLVLPEGAKPPEVNPFERMIQERQKRA